MAIVFIPTPLRKLVGGQTTVTAPGTTLRELIDNLDATFPGLRERLLDPEDQGRLMPGLTAIVEGEPINMGLRTKLEDDTEVHFLPAIAGGSRLSHSEMSFRVPAKPGRGIWEVGFLRPRRS